MLGPPDIEQRIGLTGGNIFQGEVTPDQMWEQRLTPRTPVPASTSAAPPRTGRQRDRPQRPQRRHGGAGRRAARRRPRSAERRPRRRRAPAPSAAGPRSSRRGRRGRVVVVGPRPPVRGQLRAAGMVRTQGGTPTAVDLGRWTVASTSPSTSATGSTATSAPWATSSWPPARTTARRAPAPGDAARARTRRALGDAGAGGRPAAAARSASILGATYCEQDGAISPPRNVAAYLVMMRERGVRCANARRCSGCGCRAGA